MEIFLTFLLPTYPSTEAIKKPIINFPIFYTFSLPISHLRIIHFSHSKKKSTSTRAQDSLFNLVLYNPLFAKRIQERDQQERKIQCRGLFSFNFIARLSNYVLNLHTYKVYNFLETFLSSFSRNFLFYILSTFVPLLMSVINFRLHGALNMN